VHAWRLSIVKLAEECTAGTGDRGHLGEKAACGVQGLDQVIAVHRTSRASPMSLVLNPTSPDARYLLSLKI
jgi:hypothetical protein